MNQPLTIDVQISKLANFIVDSDIRKVGQAGVRTTGGGFLVNKEKKQTLYSVSSRITRASRHQPLCMSSYGHDVSLITHISSRYEQMWTDLCRYEQMLPVVNTRCVTNSWSHLADLCKCFSQKFLVDPTKIGYFVLTLMMHVHCTIYKHTNTNRKWIKLLKPGHPNKEKVEPPHLHTWGPVWPDPTADSHSGRRKWDSCSCATWSGVACRFWSAPSGTGQTQFV